MKNRQKIFFLGLHSLFCILTVYWFCNFSYIRYLMEVHLLREIICAVLILFIIYLNYLVLCPLFFKKRDYKGFILITILLIGGSTVIEYFLVRNGILKYFGLDDKTLIFIYLRNALLLIFLRNAGLYLLFTAIKLYQLTQENALLEKKEALKSGVIVLPSLRGNPISFNINFVSYFSQNKNYTSIYGTFGKPISIYSSLSYIQDYLDEYCLRINKTNIVTFSNIISYDNENVKVKAGKTNMQKSLPFYKNRANEILTILQKKLPELKEKNVRNLKKTVIDNVNDDKKSRIDIVNLEILEEIRKNPGCNALKLFQIFPKEISLVTLRRRLKDLTDSGLIEFRGAPKTGGYFARP